MTRTSAIGRVAMAVAMSVVVAGCGTPGKSGSAGSDGTRAKKIDVAKAGAVTLTVWDQEVRGGQNAAITRLNSEFMAKYPNVKIKRVAKSFNDIQTTLKTAVAGRRAPDVAQANQGRPVMGQLVKAGLLLPLDKYADIYGWKIRYSPVLLDLNRFSSDGKNFGSGEMYGLSQTGEIVGVFYDRRKVAAVPRTFAEFEAQLADAKRQGDIGIQLGNLDKFGGIHDYQTILAQTADKKAVRDFVFARPGASFDKPGFAEAATKLQEWVNKGYLTPNTNGVGYDATWAQFAKGKGRFLIAGTWLVGDLVKALGPNVGFFVMPPTNAGAPPVALGGEGLPFSIISKTKHPDVAAAYIDFLTSPNAAKVLAETNNLPALPVPPAAVPRSGLPGDVFSAWKKLTEHDGLIPYLDYTTPTAYDVISGAIQRLIAGKDDPKAFVAAVQDDYRKFIDKQ